MKLIWVCLPRVFSIAYKLRVSEPWFTLTMTEADSNSLLAVIHNVRSNIFSNISFKSVMIKYNLML